MNHSNLIPLQEVYDYLASGELSNLFMADGGLGTGVLKDKYKAVVNKSIYLGLTDLHSRFLLKKKRAEFSERFTRTNRQGVGNYTTTVNGLMPDKAGDMVILDPEFVEILEIKYNHAVLKENDEMGYVLLQNNRFRLGKNVLEAKEGFSYEVLFQANHSPITETTTHIELPRMYLNALCYFIASRLYTSIVNQLDGDLNESNRYAQKYHQEIMMLESKGYDVDNANQMCLFHAKGFI